MLRIFFITYLYIIAAQSVHAQHKITGVLIDAETNTKIDNASVRNIYTLHGMTTDTSGTFEITVKKNELIEVSKLGYETVRIRIYDEQNPTFYQIQVKRKIKELAEVRIKAKHQNFEIDSARYRTYYDNIIRKEHKNEIDMRSRALAMLSRKTRQEWAFQEMFERWEQQRYVDSKFNEKLITALTGLNNDEMQTYIRMYKPSYEYIRSMTEYEFLEYIKYTANIFRAK